jgi:uncharacterized protein (DUF2267 family)
MQYDEFTRRVQAYAGLGTSDEAMRLTEAVFATLGECLYRTEEDDLAAQLPRELKDALVAKQPPEQSKKDVQRFSLEDFYNRIRARVGTGYPSAVKEANAVITVLQEAVSAGEIAAILDELPDEFGVLFRGQD